MHELCGARTGNYDFNWKQALFGERIPKKFATEIEIWHLLHGITLWMIWIDQNNRVFNHEQWHESKMKHLIWDNLIMYAKMAWERVVNLLRLASTWPKPSFKDLIKLGEIGTFFLEVIK